MLSSHSSGKILSRKYNEARNSALTDSDHFSSDDLSYLGVTGHQYERNDKYQCDQVLQPRVDGTVTTRKNAVDARDLGDTGRVYG